MNKYNFDADFQRTIAAHILFDEHFMKRAANLIEADYFHQVSHAALTEISLDLFRLHKTIPSLTIIRKEIADRCEKRLIRPDLKDSILEELAVLAGIDLSNHGYVADEVRTFARHQAMEIGILKAAELLEAHDIQGAADAVAAAGKVDFSSGSEGYDYFEKAAERFEQRRALAEGEVEPNGISTGYAAIDKRLYHRGWGIGEVTLFAGWLKSGKSVQLADIGKNAALQGKNVLSITLEVSNEIYAARLDSNISGSQILDFGQEAAYTNAFKRVEEVGKTAGKLILHEYPTKSFSTADLEALLEDYSARGIIFDMVTLDYLDLLRPVRYYKDDSIREGTESIEDFRRLCSVFQFAGITATQLNREGGKSKVATALHLANNIETGRIADLLITINKTEKEREDSKMRLYFAAGRNQKDGFSIEVGQDLARMRPITKILEVKADE